MKFQIILILILGLSSYHLFTIAEDKVVTAINNIPEREIHIRCKKATGGHYAENDVKTIIKN